MNWIDVAVNYSASLEQLSLSANRTISFPDTPFQELKELCLSVARGRNANHLTSFLKTSGGKLEGVFIHWPIESHVAWNSSN